MHLFYLALAAFWVSYAQVSAQDESWASNALSQMTLDEKIGQLFMIAGYVDPEFAGREIGNPNIIQEIDQYITQYHVGSIAFVGPSEVSKQVALTNHYQEISKYPILIAQDLEWGLAMRIKDGMQFPKNITLGGIEDNRLIYEMGREIGRQAKLIGVHMNLSPVLDVNIEPENIVINVRSFGSSPQQVAEKGIAMIQGLQDAGIIASAKHFPGLGDIVNDPHLSLPVSAHPLKRLQEVELYPFLQAIQAGVLSIQTEHLIVPSLEPNTNIPSSLSPKVIDQLLKKEMGFKGLVLSGALRMKALTSFLSEEEIVLKAFLAGNDMLLMPQSFPKAFQIIKSALDEGKISENEIDERVLKILQFKEKAGLNKSKIVAMPASGELNTLHAKSLKRKLYRSAVSLLRDKDQLIPFSSEGSVAYVQLGEAPSTEFLDKIKKSLKLDCFYFSLLNDNAEEEQKLFQKIDNYSLIILAVYPADPRRIVEIRLMNEKNQKEELKHFKMHGITESAAKVIKALKPYQERVVVSYFGNPFGVGFFDEFSTFLMGYEADPEAQEAAAERLFLKGH